MSYLRLSSAISCDLTLANLGHLRDARKDKKPENRKDAELNASKQPQAMVRHDTFIALYKKLTNYRNSTRTAFTVM